MRGWVRECVNVSFNGRLFTLWFNPKQIPNEPKIDGGS